MSALFTIAGIGEVLWDMLPAGPQMGGAPANFTCHARALGAEARLISRVGADGRGREIITRLEMLGVWTDCIATDAAHPTGTVDVDLEAGVPRYVIHEDVAWDFIEATPCALAAAGAADAVCFGSLAQRTPRARQAVQALVAASPRGALRVFDVNLRQDYHDAETIRASLELANVVKLNDEELPVVAAYCGVAPGTQHAMLAALAARYDLRLAALTRGPLGSLLLAGDSADECPAPRVEVVDTVGAGDAFTAALITGFLAGLPLAEVNRHACAVAAFVCTQQGATPPLPGWLRDF